ncbi:MAG TPA: DUF4115 domain-containing protein [Thermomicrobiales bacterium]|nr:DUF4115 domain-containing protein [Thermomicrobiales bacterium]
MSNFGELLRQARDYKGVTLREAERATRISRAHLAALEAEDFSALPAMTDARGIVRNYGQYLGLDPLTTVELFEQRSSEIARRRNVVSATTTYDARTHWAPNFAIIAFMIIMAGIIFTWIYSAYLRPAETAAPTAVSVATVTPVSASLLAQVTVQTTEAAPPPATPTAGVAPTPTTAPAPAQVVEAPAEPTAPPVEAAEEEVATDAPATAGPHAFVIWVTDDVWVQMIVDGQVVADDVLPAGTELSYSGSSVYVESGNAAFVHVYVDGEDYGVLGDSWDSAFAFP